jgi:hypothetical protein
VDVWNAHDLFPSADSAFLREVRKNGINSADLYQILREPGRSLSFSENSGNVGNNVEASPRRQQY